MPKVNTLFNYFTSPKNAVKPSNANESLARKTQSKSDTPKKPKTTIKEAKPTKGKENRLKKTERKRSLEEDDDEVEEEIAKTPKRRRIIIPDDDSDDDVDEYVPDAVKASSSSSEEDSETEEETPKKRLKTNDNTKSAKAKNVRSKNTTTKKDLNKSMSSTVVQEQTSAKASVLESWPHLKYDFVQPNKIKDIKKRPLTDPNYDSTSIYVPPDFLNNQTPAMRQWWVLKSTHYDCVLFFKVGKFYELYHMDAVVGVNELNLSFMRGEFAHCGFPEIAYGRFSASLIERGYKVARIEQTENPEMMSERCSKMSKPSKFDKVVKREICQISTKGTRVYTSQDAESSEPTSNYLLSLVEKHSSSQSNVIYGVCFLDTTIGDFNLGQFEDDRCNSRLLTLLAHYPPAHVIYERENLSQNTLKLLNNLLPNTMKEGLQKDTQFWSATKLLKFLHEGEYFKDEKESNFSWPKGLEPYLSKGDSLGLTPSDDKDLAVKALGGCVHLLKEYLLEQQLLSQGRFKTYTPPDAAVASNKAKLAYDMVLDAITIYNLRILGNEGSLIKTLDHCSTPFGKRLLREWICRPSCRKAVIMQRQEAISELLDRPDVVQDVRTLLSKIPDLERLLSKIHAQGNAAKVRNHPDGRAIMFEGNTYSKRKIVDFVTLINGYEECLKVIELFSDFNSQLIRLCTKVEPDGDFPCIEETLNHFKTSFDHVEAQKVGSIIPKKGLDPEYDSVMSELEDNKKELDEYLRKQRQHFGVKVSFCGNDKKRFQIEVPESQVKKAGNGYELQGSRKGFKRYYTAEAKELLSRQIHLEEQKDKVLADVNRKIFAKFSQHYDMWSTAAYNIAVLDVLLSLSEYCRSIDACIPEILDDTSDEIFTEIREGKHPCVTSDDFIANDTVLATGETAPLVILTGPNMGGKSTLMRQVGLITIMAQIGCHVPASSVRLSLTDRIFTRLGANDDIMAGQSTFLVELKETAAILQHATKYSLVLLDELGRGTSTYDGTAIAASVVDALTKKNCRTLFSTHYHSLVEDYKTDKHVTLAHMACMVENAVKEDEEDSVTQENVTFLYKLSEGACPKSYGFNAARLAGIPARITKRAYEIANKLEAEVNLRHAFTALCKLDDTNIRTLIEAL